LRFKKFLDFDTVALSFVFDNYCTIMNQLGSKICLSNYRQTVQLVIFLMIHACAARFDMMENFKKKMDFEVKSHRLEFRTSLFLIDRKKYSGSPIGSHPGACARAVVPERLCF